MSDEPRGPRRLTDVLGVRSDPDPGAGAGGPPADDTTSEPDDESGAGRGWLVPLVSLVAVALVAAIGTVAVRVVADGPERERPATTSASSDASADGASTDDAATDDARDASCARLAPAELPGATLARSITAPLGAVDFYVTGTQWVLCDDNGVAPTVHPTEPLQADGPVKGDVRVSSTPLPAGADAGGVRFVAGGLVPTGLSRFEVAYRFPDGHVEYAATREDDDGRTWWRMVYTATDGPLAADAARRRSLEPLEVTVRADGRTSRYSLVWGPDTCSQVNRSC